MADELSDFDSAHFRAVLGHFPTGVTIVTGLADGQPIGFTVGSFMSISLDPPLVGFLAMHDSETWTAMAQTPGFCVNVLCNTQAALCWRFVPPVPPELVLVSAPVVVGRSSSSSSSFVEHPWAKQNPRIDNATADEKRDMRCPPE